MNIKITILFPVKKSVLLLMTVAVKALPTEPANCWPALKMALPSQAYFHY